jgi:hypothetical protein
LLLVGDPLDGASAAWLFDLNVSNRSPKRLAIPDSPLGNTVALSDKFAAVGAISGLMPPRKTLIMALEDGSTTVLDGLGFLSLDHNLLVRARPTSINGAHLARFELFKLSNKTKPRLIAQRQDIFKARAKENLLVSMQNTWFGIQLCIEQIPNEI